MASLSTTWLYQDRGLRSMVSAVCFFRSNCPVQLLQGNARTCFSVSFPKWQFKVGLNSFPKRSGLRRSVKCQNTKKDKDKDEDEDALEHVFVEQPPYHSYMDSTSGQMEPASGARASIPGRDYWPEGTADRVRAANAPAPIGESTGSPSSGKKPGSRRKKNKAAVAAAETPEMSDIFDDAVEAELINEGLEDSKDLSSEFVVYQTEPEEEELTGYALDKKLGLPHPFIDPKVKKPIEDTLTSEELWWNWRKPDKEQWSRWQRRRPDVETPSHFALKKALSPQPPIKGVRPIPLEQELFGEPINLVCRKDSEPSWLTRHVFLKAMAETGQVKLYGDHPTLTETSLYRARRHLYKDERLQAESERLKEVGPLAYYSEWVKAWKRDTSREAVQKHFEDTGEDENTQLIEMFTHQTDREYRIMMGTDTRIRRDPLAMRMREDQIKQIWGGDPVYPTVNYIQDPDEVIDFRGPDFHEPTPNMLSYLKEHGKIISREELDNILAKEKTEQLETTDIDEAMAQAVDIGENDDEGDGSDTESSEEGEKITRNWSVLKSTPELRKTKEKPKKNGMSLDEAIDDSENITDFIMDFDEDE